MSRQLCITSSQSCHHLPHQLHAIKVERHGRPFLPGCRQQPAARHQQSLHQSRRRFRRPAALCVSGWITVPASPMDRSHIAWIDETATDI